MLGDREQSYHGSIQTKASVFSHALATRRISDATDLTRLLMAVVAVIALETALLLWSTGGRVIYTLDDPYIHLALAENLARNAHYGINLQEYSSASSSIIWPFLLVPFFMIGLGAHGPLILNVLFAIAGALATYRVLETIAEVRGLRLVLWPWALFLFFSTNGFGLVFTGMEHLLHVVMTLLTIYCINRMHLETGRKISDPPRYDLVLVDQI